MSATALGAGCAAGASAEVCCVRIAHGTVAVNVAVAATPLTLALM
jgi:hypothetical protein